MTIYDTYATASKTVTFAPHDNENGNEDVASGTRCSRSSVSADSSTTSDKVVTFVDGNENVHTSCRHSTTEKCSLCATSDTMEEYTSSTLRTQGMSPTCDTSPMTHSLYLATDAKKRPLSISSTSSSTSSTSSLPRHQRKKIAIHNVDSQLMENPCYEGVSSPTHQDSRALEIQTDASHDDKGETRTETYMDTSPSPSIQTIKHAPLDNSSVISSTPFPGSCTPLTDSCRNSPHSSQSNVSIKLDFNRIENNGSKSPSISPQPSRFNLDLSGTLYIDRVVAEILETERTYVRDLRDIIQGYLEHLDQSPSLAINLDDKTALFGNIQQVYKFNSELLSCLEDCQSDPVKMAECFVKKNEGFAIYADYCTNYPRAVEVLTSCMGDGKMAETFKQQQISLKHGLPLGSYLLKPVQRILKYHLLLQNILNNFEKSRSGYDVIEAALSSMTRMAQHINEMKRKHERTVRIQEIQSILYGWEGADLTTYGDLVLEDTFRMSGAKAHRHIFLFDKCVFIAKRREDGNLLTKAHIMCSNLMLIESVPKEPLSFHLIPFDNPRNQLTIKAKTLEKKRQWCLEIKRLILEHYNVAIPDKAKEIVLTLGKSKEEEEYEDSHLESPLADPSNKSHSAPEYLEKKRKGRRRSTSIIPDFGILKGHKRKAGKRRSSIESPRASPQRELSLSKHSSLQEEEEEEDDEEENTHEHTPDGGLSLVRSLSLESIHELMSSNRNLALTAGLSGSRRLSTSSQLLANRDKADLGMFGHVKRAPSYRAAQDRLGSTDGILDTPENGYVNSKPCDNSDSFNGKGESVKDSNLDGGYVSVMFSKSDEKIPTVQCREPPYENVIFSGAPKQLDFSSLDGESHTDEQSHLTPSLNCHDTKQFVSHEPQQSTISQVNENQCKMCKGLPPKSPSKSKDVLSPSRTSKRVAEITGRPRSHSDVCEQSSLSLDNMDVHVSSENLDGEQTRKTAGKHKQTVTLMRSHSSAGYCSNKSGAGAKPISPLCKNTHKPSQGSRSDCTSPLYRSSTSNITSALHLNDSPIQFTGAYRNSVSSSINKVSVSDENLDDPWIPRTVEHMKEEVKVRAVMRQNSMSAIEKPRVKQKTKRSNSFSSLDDLDKVLQKDERIPPNSTVVFTNHTVYLASKSNPRTIKKEPEIQKVIERFCTPLREFGPADVIQDVLESKDHGLIVTRYGTPPRTSPLEECEDTQQAATTDKTLLNDVSTRSNSPFDAKASSSQFASIETSLDDRKPRSFTFTSGEISLDGRDSWSDFDDSCGTPFSSRPGSFHGTTQYSVQTNLPSNAIQSPLAATPVASHDSLVDSLRNAVVSIKDRLTGRSVENSPIRTPRARSAGAVEDMRIDRRPRTPSPKSNIRLLKPKENKKDNVKEKRNRFVYQLARAYSDRIKGKKAKNLKSEEAHDFSNNVSKRFDGSMELAHLLKEQGGHSIGERMAMTRPNVTGTYTLRRHKSKQTKKKFSNDENKIDNCKMGDNENTVNKIDLPSNHIMGNETSQHTDGAQGERSDSSDSPNLASCSVLDEETKAHFRKSFHQLLAISQSDISQSDNESMNFDLKEDFFYERKFVEDLETSLGDNVSDTASLFKDGSLFADDPSDSDELAALKINIRETVKLMETRKSKPIPKIEVKCVEKASCIKDILKQLEATTTGTAPGGENVSGDCSPLVSRKTVRDRHRELSECAMLTRIRQNSFDDTLETVISFPSIESGQSLSLVKDPSADADATEDALPKKGLKTLATLSSA